MVGYTLMSDEELGLNTYIKKDKIGRYIEFRQNERRVRERLYLEDTPIASQRSIVCRGTACYRAKRKKALGFCGQVCMAIESKEGRG